MLNNHHEEAGRLLADYQVACVAVDSGRLIIEAFDDADAIEPD